MKALFLSSDVVVKDGKEYLYRVRKTVFSTIIYLNLYFTPL